MNKRDTEILSAYLDNELSEKEKNEFETQLVLSIDLQARLEELVRIRKLTIASYKPLQEAPYLETRIIAAVSEEKHWYSGIKKYAPVIGFASLAIILMVFLKFNPDIIDELVEQQKTTLAGFYKENLKPLLFAADLNNEDIFNFAFYKQLPLDNDNRQFLHLGADTNGSEFFEIKTASLVHDENNFEKFVRVLNLNELQREQMDSILEAYAVELQSQVLVNDKNTVAINPNLWNYNKAIVADLLAFASTANKTEFRKVMPAGYNFYIDPEIDKVVQQVKLNPDNNYIFFTPDTIFSEPYEFEMQDFKVEVQRMKEEQKKNLAVAREHLQKSMVMLKLDSNFVRLKKDNWNKNFKVMIDSNLCRVHIPDNENFVFELPNFDSITAHIDKITKEFDAFAFSIPKLHKGGSKYNFRIEVSDSIDPIDIQIPNVDSLIRLEKLFADSVGKFSFKNFHFNPDSIAAAFRFFGGDTSAKFQNEDFKKQMKQLEKEMEFFRKEMEEMKKNMKKEKPEIRVDEPIEI